MNTKTNKHGGARKGAGAHRKLEIAINRTMKFTDTEWIDLTQLGRAKWIRQQIKLVKEAI